MLECIPLREAREAVCKPRPSSSYCDTLIEHLESIGVECYVSTGRLRVGRLRMLGSGWAGNVFAAYWRGRLVAIKALKPGSRRASMLREALLHSVAAMYGVAPEVYAATPYAIVMRLVEGTRLAEYDGDAWRAKLVARRLLFKAFILDKLGIDHGELARPGGQVLVENDEPYIIDFDSASARRKPRNVTALASGLQKIPAFRGLLRPSSDPAVREVLRRYRANPCLETFEEVLKALGL